MRDEKIVKWQEQFDSLSKTPPKVGDVLRAYGKDTKIKVTITLQEGKPPFIFARAYVPQIVGHELGWFCHDVDSKSTFGWKCILMSRQRNEVIRRFGLGVNEIGVKALRVVRESEKGKSLLCEIAEW